MKFHRLSVFQIPGIGTLPNGSDVSIAPYSSSQPSGLLTKSTAPFDDLFRDRGAFAVLFSFIFSPPDPGIAASLTTPEERFAYARSLVKLEVNENHTYLIIKVSDDLDISALQHVGRIGDVGQILDEIDFTSLIDKSDRAFHSTFTAISLSFSDHPIDTTVLLGSAIWTDEQDTECRLFAMHPKLSAHLTVARGMNASQAQTASTLVKKISEATKLGSCARLLSQASERSSDRLLSFLSAWTALEIFVQEVFKTTYEPEYFGKFSKSVPPTAGRYVDKIREVMGGKYNIREKFIAIASALDHDNAEIDIESFVKLKSSRDGLAHAMKGDIDALPSEATQALARKYLRLHLLR